MGKKVTSTTMRYETELLGGGHEHVTKISDGTNFVKGSGTTAEKSQEAAGKKWNARK